MAAIYLQETLDLLEGLPGQPALGVFPLLDEACRLPKATSADLAHTVRTRLAGKPRFDAPKRSQKSFTVRMFLILWFLGGCLSDCYRRRSFLSVF
jgi:myosin heavy subunit